MNPEWRNDLLQYQYIEEICSKFDKLLNEEE